MNAMPIAGIVESIRVRQVLVVVRLYMLVVQVATYLNTCATMYHLK